jgi:Phage integrase family
MREDVDFDNFAIRVHGKGNKQRLVLMSIELRKVLYRHLSKHNHALAFATSRGTALTPRNADGDFKVMCRKLGISSVRCSYHTLRHSFGLIICGLARTRTTSSGSWGTHQSRPQSGIYGAWGLRISRKCMMGYHCCRRCEEKRMADYSLKTLMSDDDETLLEKLTSPGLANVRFIENIQSILQYRYLQRTHDIIKELKSVEERTRREIAILSDSSDRMERLTLSLKRFTIWLMVFAAVQIVIAGIQTYKMFQPEPSAVAAPRPPHSAPQTPIPPPR